MIRKGFDMKKCGQRIKSERALLGLSQVQLAEKIGMGVSAVTNWERGLTEPSCKSLARLSDAFGCSIDYLLGIKEVRR